MKKLFSIFIVLLLVYTSAFASGIYYLPDVTGDMSDPAYWSEDDTILMTYDEIVMQNQQNISTRETCMYDLKNQSETIDGISLNNALLKSTQADADYYIDWTYIENDVLATAQDYKEFIDNTQNPGATEKQQLLYGIVVRQSELRTFPSPKAIWDDPADIDLDYQYLTALRVNEPLVITSVSADGKYYLAKSICCSGWVSAEDVAICKDKTQWLSAWDIAPEDVLVVYGDKVYTETSVTGSQTSRLMLTMGTVLKKADVTDPNILIDNRAAYQNYAVWIPTRTSEGKYEAKLTLIPERARVSNGYLPMTGKNIAKVTFGMLGNTYGWGGSLNSDDCSGYMRNVYKCFGMELARNTSWQAAMPVAKVDMSAMCREEREEVLQDIPFGAILHFNGHEMMYLGSRNGKYYVISAVGSMMQPGNDSIRQRIRSVVINTLDVKRANGNTWMDELTVAVVPYIGQDNKTLPGYAWYHDGVKYCTSKNILKIAGSKKFNLYAPVTCGDFADAICQLEGKTVMSADEAENMALNWAKTEGLISESATSETTLTRQEFVAGIYTYYVRKGMDVAESDKANLSKYKDANEISSNAFEAMNYAVVSGIVGGKSATGLRPTDIITRAEAAVLFERFSTKITAE